MVNLGLFYFKINGDRLTDQSNFFHKKYIIDRMKNKFISSNWNYLIGTRTRTNSLLDEGVKSHHSKTRATIAEIN